MFHLRMPFWTFKHNKHLTLSCCAQQKYFSSHDYWNLHVRPATLACLTETCCQVNTLGEFAPDRSVCTAGEGIEGGGTLAAPATSYSRDLIQYMIADAWVIQCVWLILSRKFSSSPAGRKLCIWRQASRAVGGVFTEVNWLKLRYILHIMIFYVCVVYVNTFP